MVYWYYWFEREFNEKLISVSYNEPFDKYPDLWGVLEGGRSIPIEVEWTTKDFNHDPKIIEDNNGLIVVLQNNNPTNFGLKQLELSKDKFEKWYVKNSKRIFSESIDTVIKEKSQVRRPPKLWFYYSSKSSYRNREKTLESGTMGVPKTFRQLERFKDIRKGDLYCFIGPFENFKGRSTFEDFRKNRKIICKSLVLFRVSKGHYKDDTKIWDHLPSKLHYVDDMEKKIGNFPQRFDFKKTPILNINDIKLTGLSVTSKRSLHRLVNTIFWEGDPNILIDLISRSR